MTIQYDDPNKPGILDLTGASLTAWENRKNAPSPVLPDIDPANPPGGESAPILPQDAHFTLNFAHPTVDGTGIFQNALPDDTNFPADIVSPKPPPPPSDIAADDMSNLNLNPSSPSVQFDIRHTLTEVSISRYDSVAKAWKLVCPPPQHNVCPNTGTLPDVGATQLCGVWLSGDPKKANPRQAMTQLKVFPWRLLPGQYWTAQWSSQSPQQVYGTSFTDQNLQFSLAAGLKPAAISSLGQDGVVPGLSFYTDNTQNGTVITIRFPQPSLFTSISAMIARQGESGSFYYDSPSCSGDGALLTPQSSSQDPTTKAYTLTFPDKGVAIQQLTIAVSGYAMFLYAIDYSTPPTPAAILPEAPAFYALKTVTKIEAKRVGSPSDYQVVTNGDPIIEFVYFQTAAGPGTAEGAQAPTKMPVPVQPAPYPPLAQNCKIAQQPTAVFPLAGAISDLHTYIQWSWPLDGATSAYYGYDFNVEFVESYVNALYTAFSSGSVADSLHFRCVDRNNMHTILVPNAIHVPSIPQQSALVAGSATLPFPGSLQTPTPLNLGAVTKLHYAELQKHAQLARNSDLTPDIAPVYLASTLPTLLQNTNIGEITGGLALAVLQQIEANSAAQEAQDLWFRPLLPNTRYTLDVVAGPLYRTEDRDLSTAEGTLGAVFAATDATGLLAALKDYYAYEDSLTTLQRVQYTTSRYATFGAQLTNAINQLAAAPGATHIRHYVASTDPITWFGTVGAQVLSCIKAGQQYLADHDSLQKLVAGFDPLADDLQPSPAPAANGAAALVKLRNQTAQDWTAFAQDINSLYDGLITAFGHQEMATLPRQSGCRIPKSVSLPMPPVHRWKQFCWKAPNRCRGSGSGNG